MRIGQLAIVTRGSSAIGSAIAERLSAIEMDVILIDDSRAAARSHGGGDVGRALDLTDPEAVERCVNAIMERYGRIDCLIQIAAGPESVPFLSASASDFDQTIAENLTSAFVLSQSVATRMAAGGGGSILHVTDASAISPANDLSIYAASQAGIVQLVRVMAVDLAAANIRVNALVTPSVQRSKTTPVFDTESSRGQAFDIAGAASFLSSREASYINGHVLHVGTAGLESA